MSQNGSCIYPDRDFPHQNNTGTLLAENLLVRISFHRLSLLEAPMKSRILVAIASLSFCTVASAVSPTKASAQDTFSQWLFTGQCTDCAQAANVDSYQVTGLLTLKNYVVGNSVDINNFVSFFYHGSNLLDPYFVYGAGGTPMTGVDSYIANGLSSYVSPDYLYGNLYFASTDTPSYEDLSYFSLYFTSGDTYYYRDWSTCIVTDESACLEPADFGSDWSLTPYTAPVPEPASLALISVGLGALALTARRRRSQR